MLTIPDPDEYNLQMLGRNSCLASVPGFQYRKNRDVPWVIIASRYSVEEIRNKMIEVSTTAGENGKMLQLALLTSLSFKKVEEINSLLNEIIKDVKEIETAVGGICESTHWVDAFVKYTREQAARNSGILID